MVTTAAAIVAFVVMFSYASGKTIIIDEEVVEEETESEEVHAYRWVIDTVSLKSETENEIVIPSPSATTLFDADISVRYDVPGFSVTVKDTRESYFLSNPMRGDFSHVTYAEGMFDGENTVISFSFDTPMAVDSQFQGNGLKLKLTPVTELDVPVVIVDPGHGGNAHGARAGNVTEKDITLAISKELEKQAVGKPYRILLTRSSDIDLKTVERISSVENTGADFYIGLHLSSDAEDTKLFGMKAAYNGVFYRNGFENADFADLLLKNTTMAAFDRAIGLFEATDDDAILKVISIPAAVLYCGYLSNADELELLSSDAYIQKIAGGIISAIDEAVDLK